MENKKVKQVNSSLKEHVNDLKFIIQKMEENLDASNIKGKEKQQLNPKFKFIDSYDEQITYKGAQQTETFD